MHELYYIAIIILSGIIMARVVSILKLPHVTGYLLAGVLIGPSIFNLVPKEVSSSLEIISEAALGFIAYSIGSEINFQQLKKVGKSLITITFFEALCPVILVTLTMVFIFKQSLAFSMVIGAIASATAPAATIMIIRQYRAKGPVVDTLLPVVAMDDGVAIVAFGIAITIAKSLMNVGGEFSIISAIFMPIWEIILALGIGFIIGIILCYVIPKIKGEDELLCMVIASVFAAIGLATLLNVSTLLVCMMIGVTVSNLARNSTKALHIVNRITPPIFISFFTLAGIDLDLGVLRYAGLMGIAYVLVRVIGKIVGASIGARLTNSDKMVQKYLGFALVPQAGVAIGLSMIAQTVMPEFGSTIRTVILASTVIYELVGPVIAKTALVKAGEINLSEAY
ncbi:cation:proton antiporter [Tissierella sp. MB52-C2]|uniref:cation:proton antiporter n=1 Tax=Tissierella sp. MB52-C2 TaxID=3070999 RepID=UPI00280B4F65|nr:cation:proton antiporter [Tissierella sp. MB52-C2]WMM25184.1 cation:proton antiporter [Tissierella sp. MB52-C2]